VKLTVLGSQGTYPTRGEPTSGFLLRTGETALWIDAGAGTLAALERYLDPAEVDALIISHVHIDHSVDVFSLYHYLRFGSSRSRPMPLVLPAQTRLRLEAYANPGGAEFESTFDIVESPQQLRIGDIDLEFGNAVHPVPTLQLVASDGVARLGYSADTGPGSDLERMATDVDLLVVEATFQGSEKPAEHHLTAAEAGSLANVLRARRLMLTHILPELNRGVSRAEAAAAFGGEVLVAAAGMEVEI
jgi:ribonuclease BN (tRNA processing enzyme)